MNVEIRESNENSKGRGLFATKNIPKGSTIFEEDPIVSCQFSWNAAYKYKACDHCLRPLETATENARRLTGNPNLELPYSECCITQKDTIVSCDECDKEYCSNECKIIAFEQYHKTICLKSKETNESHPLFQLEELWKHMHYPPETNSILLAVRLLSRIVQSPNKESALAETLRFCHRSINDDADLAHKFLGKKFQDQISLLRNLMAAALPYDEIKQFLTPEGFQSLLAILGTNAQGVGSSPISQWEKRVSALSLSDDEKEKLEEFINRLYDDMERQSGDFLNTEGVALYSLQSLCNHSCVQNAEPSFLHNNHRLSLVATRDINEGEEVFINYLDECSRERSRHSRRKELMENYLFLCNCEKCLEQQEQADVTSDEDEEMSE